MTSRFEHLLDLAQASVFVVVGLVGRLVIAPILAALLFALSWALRLFPPHKGSTRERRFEKAVAVFIVLNGAVFLAEVNWSRPVEFVLIRRGSEVHIGDHKMQTMQPAAPSGYCFERALDLSFSIAKASLLLEAKNIDPDPARGPFVLLVNGGPPILVNDHPSVAALDPSDEQSISPLELEFDVPTELLRPGLNQIAGCVLPTPSGGYDDVNIYLLSLKVTRRAPWRS